MIKPTYTQKQLEFLAALSGKSLDNSGFISKAATMGYNPDPSTGMTQGVQALARQFLEPRLVSLTYKQGQLVFWNALRLGKEACDNTVYQYTVQDRHSFVGHGNTVVEGAIAAPTDPSFRRNLVYIKNLSKTSSVTLTAQLTNTLANVVETYTDDALVTLANAIEWNSFYGDSSLTYQSGTGADQGTEFDGLSTLLEKEAPENVIDASDGSGVPQPLSADIVNKAATLVAKGYSTPTDMFLPTGAVSSFMKNSGVQLVQLQNSTPGVTGTVGFRPTAFNSVTGPIRIDSSNVMDNQNIYTEDNYNQLGDGLTPVVTATVDSAKKDGAFAKADIGSLNYYVQAVAGGRESAPASVTAALVNQTDAVELSIQVPSIYQARIEYVSIYRQSANGEYYLIGRIGTNTAVNGTITFRDVNDNIPGTTDAFIGELSPRTIKLVEQLPIAMLPLSQQNATYNWTTLWYGALALLVPRAWVHIKNLEYMSVTPQY